MSNKIETAIKSAEAVIAAGVEKDPVAGAAAAIGAMTSLYYNDKMERST
jgi:hypothetical protein